MLFEKATNRRKMYVFFESFSKNTMREHLLSCKSRQGYFTKLLQKNNDKQTI